MDPLAFFAVLLLVLGALFLGLLLYRYRPVTPAPSSPDEWGPVLTRRVVVNLKSGQALDGVLVRRDKGLLFLRNVTLLAPGADPLPVDGEAVILAGEIDFIQAL